jgi:hypothetical protein
MTQLLLCVDAKGARGIVERQVYTMIDEVPCCPHCGGAKAVIGLAETPQWPKPRHKWCKRCKKPVAFDRCYYVKSRFVPINNPGLEDELQRELEKERAELGRELVEVTREGK